MVELGCTDFTVVVVVLSLLARSCVNARNNEVSVRLHIVNYDESAGVCPEADVNLSRAFIIAQYREVNTSSGEIATREWQHLAKINFKTGFDGILKLPSLLAGVQLRLLQLKHGGGSCNCWRMEEALLMWGSSSSRSILQQPHCSTTVSPTQSLFCGGSANIPRGFTSNPMLQQGRGGDFGKLKNLPLSRPCSMFSFHEHKRRYHTLNQTSPPPPGWLNDTVRLEKTSQSIVRSVEAKRLKRQSDDLSGIFNVLFSLASTEEFGTCIGGNVAGLGRTTVRLEYRSQLVGGDYETQWTRVDDIPIINSGEKMYSIAGPSQSMSAADQGCLQFRLVQEEHGGAYCNCWSVQNLQLENMGTTVDFTISNSVRRLLCETSASVRRILTCTSCNDRHECTNMAESDLPRRRPFNISESCSAQTPHLQIFFQIILQANRFRGCDNIDNPNEGIEFSLRFNNETWIPVIVVHRGGSQNQGLPIGDFSDLVIRDYFVEDQVLSPGSNNVTVSLVLCNFHGLSDLIQFRWLQTADFVRQRIPPDFWGLDNLRISYVMENREVVLLSDSFGGDSLNSSVWPIEGRRDANLSTMCTGENQALTFGLNNVRTRGSASRSIRSAPISLDVSSSATTTATDPTSTTSAATTATDPTSTTSAATTATDPTSSTSAATTATDPTSTTSAATTATDPTSTTSVTTTATDPTSTTSAATTATDLTSTTSATTTATDPTSTTSAATTATDLTSTTSATTTATDPTSTTSAATTATDPTSTTSAATTATDPTSTTSATTTATDPTSTTSVTTTATDPTSTTSAAATATDLTSTTSATTTATDHTLSEGTTTAISTTMLPTTSPVDTTQAKSTESNATTKDEETVTTTILPTADFTKQSGATDYTSTPQNKTSTVYIPTDPTSTRASIFKGTESPAKLVNSEVLHKISKDSDLKAVTETNYVKAIDFLKNLTTKADPPEPAVTLFLLGDILNRFNSSAEKGEELELATLQNFLKIGENLIASKLSNQDVLGGPEVIGSSLLSVVDRLALEVFPETGNISTGNISIRTLLISNAKKEEYTTTLDSSDINSNFSRQNIQIPRELIQIFANRSFEDSEAVRVISSLLKNVENLFPTGRNNSVLGSGIVSTSLQCGDVLCDTQSIQLENPVIITIQHSEMELERFDVDCVFWSFANSSSSGVLLSSGEWSNDGCYRNDKLSNSSKTVCECYHLTHFAILLSPVPLHFTSSVQLSLEVISFVGVAVSLVAMAITVVTFIFLRSLHNMRNYIHINLCINLMIAQLIFVVGIDRSADDHVPVHCQAIAVLLHYFFLVSFMWMLMEGVVLYIVLVLVFVKKTKYYMIGFTLASYGIPLLYMGLTLPLGFALNNLNYGTTSFCFLDPETHFIWAFIAPVIVIILINFVLFLIVARVMWKHQKRRTDKSKVDNVKRWLRSAMFLVIIMGLTWIMGVLVLEVDALLPLTYIFTIMVACQGLFIFIIFVVFSKQVREAYKKWVKTKVADSTVFSRVFGDSFSGGIGSDSSRKTSLSVRNFDVKKKVSVTEEGAAQESFFVITNNNVA